MGVINISPRTLTVDPSNVANLISCALSAKRKVTLSRYKDEYWNPFMATPALEHMTPREKTHTFGTLWQQLYSQRRKDAAMKIVFLQGTRNELHDVHVLQEILE